MGEPQLTFDGGDSSQHLTNCLICYTSAVTPGETVGGENNAALSLEKSVRAYFVLRHVLKFPPEKVTRLVGLSTALNDLGSLVSLCWSCADKVEELSAVYREMVWTAIKFEEMRRKILEESNGNLGKGMDMEAGSGQAQLIWRWRKQLHKAGAASKPTESLGASPCQNDDYELNRDKPEDMLVKEEPSDETDGDPTHSFKGDKADNKIKAVAPGMETQVAKGELTSCSDSEDDDWDGGSQGGGGGGDEDDSDCRSGAEDDTGDGGDSDEDDDYPEKGVKKFQCDVEGCRDKGKMIDLETFLGHYHYHADLIFKCSECPRLFTKVLGVNNHWRVNHKDLWDSATDKFLKVPPTHPGIPWWCTECPSDGNKIFWSEETRNEHLKIDHLLGIQPKDFPNACNECSKKYPSILELKLHQGIKHTLACNKCNELFTNKLALTEHYKTAHQPKPKKNSRKLQCDLCPKSYYKKSEFASHRRCVHRLDLFKCPDCSKEFTKERSLALHVKHYHQPKVEEKVPCPHCAMIFKSKYNLEHHISRVHLKETIHCEHCNKSVPKLDLKLHLFQRHGIGTGKKHPCPMEGCTDVFFRKSSLKSHLRQKHNCSSPQFPCCHCGKLFYSKYSRRRHERTFHVKELPSFKCRFCDKTCSRIDNLKKHEEYHTDPEKEKRLRRKCYPCDKCKETFRQAILLKRHTRRVHEPPRIPKRSRPRRKRDPREPKPVKVVGPVKCQFCGRVLKTRYILQVHIRIVHKKLDRACCDICGKELSGRGSLKSHQALVHKIGWTAHLRRFECGVEACGKKLRTKKLLEWHMSRHSGTPMFQCDKCGKQFYGKKHLTRHESVVHSENKELFKCTVCGKGFACASYLWQHMKTHKSKETVGT